ncbi:MAG: ice-binding family protein [Cellulomonas sp.]
MKLSPNLRGANQVRLGVATVAAMGLLVALPGTAQAAATAVPLGTADSFVVLAGSAIANTGPSTLNGDFGTFPTTTITGTGSIVVNGTNHAGDAVTQGAKADLTTAFGVAAGEASTDTIAADLTGLSLLPGVYTSASSVLLTGELTLDAGGDPSAVFVFQAGSTLTTMSNSQVTLTNGAQACNVFWQVGTSATLGTDSDFRGTVLADQSITATTGATIEGRLLARIGAVTLDTNTITRPSCATPTPTPSSSPTPTPSPSNQVATVPVGSVSAGDGSSAGPSAGPSAAPYAVLGALVVFGLGGAASMAVRRRRLNG